jgi:hypothetical protein
MIVIMIDDMERLSRIQAQRGAQPGDLPRQAHAARVERALRRRFEVIYIYIYIYTWNEGYMNMRITMHVFETDRETEAEPAARQTGYNVI